MKNTCKVLLFLLSVTVFAQQISWEEWELESKTDMRLLPKYGNLEKTKKQKKADVIFIETMRKQDSSFRKASDRFIRLGFYFLFNNDLKAAMYRFNQAYLLDSNNTDIYWGFGAVYMTLGQYQKAKKQYEEGLKINPDNTHLLTDYGTYFLWQYATLKPIDKEKAMVKLDSAMTYMTKSYNLDSTDQQTVFKLSILYWNKGDCDNAWKYYDECKSLGGQLITEAYTNDLQKECKRKELEK
jgi:tetratricopeptide (TPR) repeat protein